MQVANLNQLVQNALQELDYLDESFVCSGLWCTTTAAAYKRFLLDEKVDPHFAGVQPSEASHLPKTLFDYIFGAVTEAADQLGEAVVETAATVIDLVDPNTTVIVNMGELSSTAVETAGQEQQPAAAAAEGEQKQQEQQQQEDSE